MWHHFDDTAGADGGPRIGTISGPEKGGQILGYPLYFMKLENGPTTYDLRPTTYPRPPTTYHLPPTYYLLPTTYYLLPTTHYLLPTTYYLVPTT